MPFFRPVLQNPLLNKANFVQNYDFLLTLSTKTATFCLKVDVLA